MLPLRAGTAPAETSAAERAADASAAHAAETSSADDHSAARTAEAVAALGADPPPHGGPARRADVGVLHLTIGARQRHLLDGVLPQGEAAAVRAAPRAIVVENTQGQEQADDEADDRKDRTSGELPFGLAQVGRAARKHLGRHRETGEHAGVVVLLPEGRKHVFHLDALAERVGEDALEAAARDEADLMQVADQQDAQSVVALRAADAPAAEQFDGEREGVAAGDVVHGDDGHLGKAPLAQCAAQRIEPRDRGGRKNAVGIRDVAVAVGPLHVGDIRGTVGRATGPEARKQQHGEQKQSFHDRKDKRSEVKKQIAPYRVRIR